MRRERRRRNQAVKRNSPGRHKLQSRSAALCSQWFGGDLSAISTAVHYDYRRRRFEAAKG
jgi:hypothetical protein